MDLIPSIQSLSPPSSVEDNPTGGNTTGTDASNANETKVNARRTNRKGTGAGSEVKQTQRPCSGMREETKRALFERGEQERNHVRKARKPPLGQAWDRTCFAVSEAAVVYATKRRGNPGSRTHCRDARLGMSDRNGGHSRVYMYLLRTSFAAFSRVWQSSKGFVRLAQLVRALVL